MKKYVSKWKNNKKTYECFDNNWMLEKLSRSIGFRSKNHMNCRKSSCNIRIEFFEMQTELLEFFVF